MRLNRLKRDLSLTVIVELLAKIPLYGFEFLLASWLLLDQYAEWASLALIYRAGPYLHLGALSYFSKRYPLLIGSGQHTAASKVQKHTNKVVNSVIISSFILNLVLYNLNYLSLTTFLVVSAVLIMQVFTFCQTKVRNDGNFSAYSMGLVIFSFLQFLVAYFTVKNYGVLAGILSTFIAYLVAVIYYLLITKTDYNFFVPTRRNFNRILKLGWAPFLLTASSFLTQTSDRLALIFAADDAKLAFYGFFSIFFQIGIIAINSIGKVLSPYILQISGKKNIESTLAISVYTCYIIICLFISINILLLLKGDWLINKYFIKFNGGLIGIYNYSTIGVLLALTLAFYAQLLAANKELLIIRINFVYFITSFLLVYVIAITMPGFYFYSLGSLLLNIIYTIAFFQLIEKIVTAPKKHFLPVRLSLSFVCVVTLIVNVFYITI